MDSDDDEDSDDESESDTEVEDRRKARTSAKFTEFTMAGGEDIRYILKRPTGAETAEHGGFEVMARLKFDLSDSTALSPPTHHWVRGYVSNYSPFDDVVHVRFFHDGPMVDYYADLYMVGIIKRDYEFEKEFEAAGDAVRYLLCRPNAGNEAVGWTVRANAIVGELTDEDENEENEYDWVDGNISGTRISEAHHENEVVYVVNSTYTGDEDNDEDDEHEEREKKSARDLEMKQFEGEIDDPLEVQFIGPPTEQEAGSGSEEQENKQEHKQAEEEVLDDPVVNGSEGRASPASEGKLSPGGELSPGGKEKLLSPTNEGRVSPTPGTEGNTTGGLEEKLSPQNKGRVSPFGKLSPTLKTTAHNKMEKVPTSKRGSITGYLFGDKATKGGAATAE